MKNNPKILIVDDEHEILDIMRFYLRKHQENVLFASSGKEAIDLLLENDVKITICDLNMPNMSGDQVFKFVKEQGLGDFYFLTGSDIGSLHTDSYLKGIFSKPSGFKEAVKLIETFLINPAA